MLESKCADLPFKLFGKLIPIFGSTLLSSAQNLNGGADGEGSRPQEDSPVADPPPDEVQEIMLFEKSNVKPAVEETAEAKRSDCGKTVPKKPEKVLPCPRCDSADTKFCYYNNYNVNQPRHFCKNCQRYWTAGGTLRNIPVGAGRRKAKHSALDSIAPSFSVPTPAASSVVISFGLDHCKDAVQALLGIPAVESNSRSVSGSHNKMGARDTAEAKSEKFPRNHDESWWIDARGPWSDGSSDGSLGKHRRCSHRQPVPRTLSITDGKEVSESSIWKNVRVKSKREAFTCAPSTDDKPIWACPSNVLCGNSNPAAHWTSMFYQNSA